MSDYSMEEPPAEWFTDYDPDECCNDPGDERQYEKCLHDCHYWTLPCPPCYWVAHPNQKLYYGTEKFPDRRVVSKGGIVNNRADPTQTYNLECGHVGM